MTMIEIETKMGKDGVIQIPEAELKATGLKEGDEICLLYVAIRDDISLNTTGEFMLEKRNAGKELPVGHF